MTVNYEKFKRITGYDLKSFFEKYASFVDNTLPFVVDYYNGGDINNEAFLELEALARESKKVEPLFELHKSTLNTIDMWEALDLFTDIATKIETVANLSKWQRSSRLGINNTNTKVSVIQSQNQTIEGIAIQE